ncbi:MAG: enoyl-CoA hydratase [Acidimicrobiales bacterium]|jgi:enoyl-CoA hydratase
MTDRAHIDEATPPELIIEVDGAVAVVTLNRPRRRNALSSTLIRSLLATITDLDSEDEVGAIVLTGADPAFCAGLDLKELGTAGNALGGSVVSEPGHHGPWPPLSTVVVGAVNGPAITGGLEIALACDFLIASERAMFADTHARLGVQPTWGLTVRLPEAVGIRRAREMSATGNFIDAPTALSWGLVNHVVPHDQLVESAVALARAVSEGDHGSIARMLQTYREGALDPGSPAWDAEWEAARSWQSSGIDAAKVAERRSQVIERGRLQL